MRSLHSYSCKYLLKICYGLPRQRLKLDASIRTLHEQTGNRPRRCSVSFARNACSGNVQSHTRTTRHSRCIYQSASQVKSLSHLLNTQLSDTRLSSTQISSTYLSNTQLLNTDQLSSTELSNSWLPDNDLRPSTVWTEEATLYVHWPYCQRRCTYCNFNKYIDSNVDHSKMQQCLVAEACTLIDLSGIKRIKSIFFGGGTPSLAKPQTLHAVLEAVSGLVDVPSNAEITMEGNPTSVGLSKLRDFKQAGINRVSIGIQALNDDDLKVLGRDHITAESMQCIEEARRLFPGHVSLDLIFGRPGQTPLSWQQELKQVLTMCDDHMSLYQLTLERGTALFKMHERGLLDLPDDDDVADMYSLAVEMMATEGLDRYEVSNFARNGCESQHNQAYWEGGQYIGIGPGAHGRFIPKNSPNGNSRADLCSGCTDSNDVSNMSLPQVDHNKFREARIQTLEPGPWMYEVLKYGHGTRKHVRQTQLDVLQELLMTAMRTRQGVTSARWAEMSGGESLSDVFRDNVQDFSSAGLIVNDSAGLRVTHKGMAVLDSILPHLLLIVQDWRNWSDSK